MSAPSAVHGVVVGIDGSASSLSAVRWAARDAQLREVGLTLVHVDDAPEAGAEADAVLGQAEAAALTVIGSQPSLIDNRHAHGKPVDELVEAAKEAQLIAVGSRGRAGHLRQRIGSVGVGLLHHAHGPVAVVHGDEPPRRGPGRKPVLVGIDGSKRSVSAAAVAFDEASRRATDLLALHVCKDADNPTMRHSDFAMIEHEAEEFLRKSLTELQQQYPGVTVHYLVRFENPARQLLVQAERAQLIVVGSHGRGAVAGKLLGSVSTAVAEQSRIPVIVARRS